MSRCVVDTNVPIVANGRPNPDDPRPPSLECREAAVKFLVDAIVKHLILLDIDGAIQAEYRKHLNPSGQPGVGIAFFSLSFTARHEEWRAWSCQNGQTVNTRICHNR